MPLHVACIIPAFNAERYLAATVTSVLEQTRPPDEIVVVDDGSTDGTARVAAGFGSRVSLIRQANAGAVVARNHGVRATRSELITFLDADDLWEPAKVELQLARMQERPELEYCAVMVCNFVSEELSGRKVRDPRLLEPLPGYSSSCLMIRRSLMERIGPFDEKRRHADDTEWLLRARESGAASELLPQVLVRRRLHESNISQTQGQESRDEYLQLVKGLLDRRRGRGPGVG